MPAATQGSRPAGSSADDACSDPAERLKLTEVFLSLQGEADSVGFPTVFVRLTGCPLRCRYCDTAYAFYGGQWWTLDSIIERVTGFGTPYVCVTGGEPLAQKPARTLLRRLCELGLRVSLETSGALPIDGIDPRVVRVVDMKTPGSGESHRNRYGDVALLTPHDQVKFVICSRADYDWSRERLQELGLTERCTVLFSPSEGEVSPRELAEWILADRLRVRFQIQLHKVLWGNAPGR